MLPIDKHKLSKIAQNRKKFIRRTDLTNLTRLYIASTAFMAIVTGTRGVITALSKKFYISRTFVYMLTTTLEETGMIIFGDRPYNSSVIEQRQAYHYMLSLRMEGLCSIEAIATIMKRFNIENSSTGSISQYLQKVGSLLPDTIKNNSKEIQFVIYLSDEIFSKNIPILVTVEPLSSAILKIELADSRKAENWKKHWHCLEDNGFVAIYLVSDEGTGICKAKKEALSDIIRQPDTYHAIAHQLGKWVKLFESAAYKAMHKEYDCYAKLDSASSEGVLNKRIEQYEKAVHIAEQKIELYENFNSLYLGIIEELRLFDCNGQLRDRKKAEENIEEYLALIEIFANTKLINTINKVRRILPELLTYFDIAKPIINNLKMLSIEKEALYALCLAWQWRKGVIKTKKSKARHYCYDNKIFCLSIAEGYLQENYDHIKEHVYRHLDQIVQSSSLVECINSIIRPYLNTSKNHVSQEFLNLIMFYHNHRRYKGGKRKGKTPYEILTGTKQDKNWIELLFDLIDEKESVNNKNLIQPNFLSEEKILLQAPLNEDISDDYIFSIASCQ